MDRILTDRRAGAHFNTSQSYEQFLAADPAGRKAAGAYYTPEPIVDYVVAQTLGPLVAGKQPREVARLRILDPACGAGAFLLGAYRFLCAWYEQHLESSLPPADRWHILLCNLFGVDLDPTAVRLTRSLLGAAGETDLDLSASIRPGDALLGADCPDQRSPTIDWQEDFAGAHAQGGFDAVLSNPPWGQKAIATSKPMQRYLRERFPSSAGIFDLFRPFVELGVRLTRPGGRFGMVLPDIILLKNYPRTRLHLLDHLTLERIDWWGKAFAGAEIDVATIVGCKSPAPAGQQVAATVHDRATPLAHALLQTDFRNNPRHTFNLHLTTARRRIVDALASCPRLGDYFEIHEGVHSGNMRADLFVRANVDATCRPLFFGRDEIAPYRLQWTGWHICLGAVPGTRTRERYANLGRPEWHAQAKLLVRRTGDRVLAAVDRTGTYASNNFFLVFPRQPCPLDLDGLCALLNSRFMTWYFRTVEPRQGRAFAELKIKHLRDFPLPRQLLEADGCRVLNELGAESVMDEPLDAEVCRLFGVRATECA
jgi:SAM-dependent methyltransferase